ncbi:Bax inhibitor-1/YccA family protein [Paracoccaceae bacterium GXU_MW_L88]
MAQPHGYQSQQTVRTGARDIDAGLRAYMNKVYSLMAIAMVVSGAVAYVFGTDLYALTRGQETAVIPEGVLLSLFNSPLKWAVMFAPLIFVFAFSATINRVSQSTAQFMLYAFAALMGLSLSSIFVFYTGMSIAQTFFATAGAFAALSLWGYTTKRDISGWGSFLFMGVIGVVIASIINIFVGSSALQFAVSVVALLVFAGLTAYDTQRLKNTYLALAQHGGAAAEMIGKSAVMGALSLYINFINMFMSMLSLFGATNE